ncbi:thiolase family protein [Enterovirga aerilata]|uniref:Thiolase family protein n=1 Tax=Enterovirga aerilata TaxID=2730920 RepID=A0A849IJJ7_9HYPH|nr:thiolase family protein [Enterovirga sp. DB1703]NNM74113.1 thiolase family protein [Enterovirga sp. DB1703]
MRFLRNRPVAIVGYADTKLVRNSGRTAAGIAGEVVASLLDTAGIERDEIDGFATTLAMSEAGNPFWSNLLAEHLGLCPRWCQSTDIGGSSNLGNIARAAMAIEAGLCTTVLCLGADAVSSHDATDQTGHRTEFCQPVGYIGPLVAFGLLSSAYAARYGMPDEALAKLAVAQREGALLNEVACDILRKPLTEADYLSSRMVSHPLRLLDCVMRCDGGYAVLVTTTARARALGFDRVVHPISYREIVNFDPKDAVDDITVSGFSVVGPEALRDAELRPDDIDVLQPYDDFLIAVLLQLEQCGFCGPGQAQSFVKERDLRFSGDLPINTGGGQVSAGQPGLAGGGVNLVEALKQLFGDARARQVRDPRRALVTGIGVLPYGRNWGSSNAMVLERA